MDGSQELAALGVLEAQVDSGPAGTGAEPDQYLGCDRAGRAVDDPTLDEDVTLRADVSRRFWKAFENPVAKTSAMTEFICRASL